MQYSKYVNNSEIVRDETSVAQSICFDDINSENFSHPSITLFLSASLILPVAVAVPSVVTVFKCYTEIERKFINHKSRPSAIGTVITGIYITIYMLCMDIVAVSMYGSKNHEYGEIDTKTEPFSLRWSYATLIVECTASMLAVLVIIARYTCISLRWIILCIFIFLLLIFLSTIFFPLVLIFIIFAPPVLFFWSKSNLIMISFLVVPIIFVSAHLDYIFAAWLTEPTKTTSVAIMAITIIFFLFVMSRTSYSFIKSFMYKRYYATCQKTLKLMDGIAFFITCIFTLAGVALVSLHVAAFFILPIPTASLAIYLENIVQIFLVIFGALITYKIISVHEPDTSKILKQLSLNNTLSSTSPNASVTQNCEPVNVLLKLDHDLTENKIKTFWEYVGQKAASIELEGAKISVKYGQNNEVLIATSKIVLRVPSFHCTKKEVHIPLDKTKLEVTLADDECTTVNISLKKANLKADANEYPASLMELRLVLPHNDTESDGGTITLVKGKILLEKVNVIKRLDSFTLPSYIIKTHQACNYPGSCIRFDNLVTFTGNDNMKKKYVLAGTTTLTIDQSDTLELGSNNISLTLPQTFEGYNTKITRSPLQHVMIIQPNSTTFCDTSFLYFPNPDQEMY